MTSLPFNMDELIGNQQISFSTYMLLKTKGYVDNEKGFEYSG
jgi:hypothetical protein